MTIPAPRDLTIITHDIAVRNALPYFEVVIQGWGGGEDDDIGRFYKLPKVPLVGIAISPESTIDTVMVLEDFSVYTGSLANYDGNSFARDIDHTRSGDNPVPPSTIGTNTGQTNGGRLKSQRSVVSHLAPLIKPISAITAIVARNSSRHNGHYFAEDGSSQDFGDKDAPDPQAIYQAPILVLRCYIKHPGLAVFPSLRVPIIANERNAVVQNLIDPVQWGNPPKHIVQAFPIGGRKTVHVEMWALPDDATGDATGIIEVKASVLRGGEGKQSVMANPLESGQFFEDEIIAPTTLAVGGSNKARTTIVDNTAEWLLLFVEQTNGLNFHTVDLCFFVRAED